MTAFSSDYFDGAQRAVMELLRQERPGLMRQHGKIEYETKADTSIVTELDKQLEIKLTAVLAKYDASIGTWGEEHGKQGNEQRYWLIDPIDGTEHFVRGLQGCRTLLTFVENDEALFALAYRFTSDDLFVAEKGKKTTKNGKAVTLSRRPLDRSWIEFNVNMRLPEGYDLYKKLRPSVAGITVHRDYLEILEGALEGLVVYKSPGQVWDYAPRALMISCAGGRVANLGSDKYDIHDTDLVATAPHIFEQVQKLLSGTA